MRKIMSIILALILTLSLTVSVNAEISYDTQSSVTSGIQFPVKGDIDGDSKISAADARLVLRMSVGLEETIGFADVDGDGKVSAADARLVLRVSVGLETFVEENEDSYFEVHFLDVGQADCSLIICDDETLLIDGGNVADSEYVVSYLGEVGVKELDYVIGTHAHEDHIGGLGNVLTAFTVTETVYAPATGATTKCYRNFVNAVQKQNKSLITPELGETFYLGNAEIQFVGPVTENYDDINNTSLVVKITYEETSFLFMGDAERESELDILETDFDLSADVLKVGHHGSDSSTTYPFLREVMPKMAVISVGEDNKYGHPTEAVLSKLSDAEIDIYRTDFNGNIVMRCNNGEIEVEGSINSYATRIYVMPIYIGEPIAYPELCEPITSEPTTVESEEIPVDESEEIYYTEMLYPEYFVGIPPEREPVETTYVYEEETTEEELSYIGPFYPTLYTGVPPMQEPVETTYINEETSEEVIEMTSPKLYTGVPPIREYETILCDEAA